MYTCDLTEIHATPANAEVSGIGALHQNDSQKQARAGAKPMHGGVGVFSPVCVELTNCQVDV